MDESLTIERQSSKTLHYPMSSKRVEFQKIESLNNDTKPRLVKSLFQFEQQKRDKKRVDGLIIGTGEADFTKGNTCYTLHIEDKSFQLLDVPGIEGNESNYVHHVKEAIAKAHMVIYVNGTNKKPETTTAEKINSYLEYGTTVYPLINVRGFADAYEFEEDREDLSLHGGAGEALNQTISVLKPILGEQVLIPGNCVQGLLAFSSLAYNQELQSTSIHPSRNKNLVLQQKSYFKFFSSRDEMQEFSNIDSIADVIRNKVSTFKEDIVESNKGKVLESLNHYLEVLNKQLNIHNTFLKKTEPEFDKCRVAFENAIKEFERRFENKRRNRWNSFFNGLMEKSDNIVENNYGDANEIKRLIKKEYDDRRSHVEREMLRDNIDAVGVLRDQMLQAVERLLQDIKHVELQQELRLHNSTHTDFDSISALNLGSQIDLGDVGSILFKIGSYAVSGAGIGSTFPVVGTVIGAIVGALVGVLMTVVGLFSSKATKIRKAQSTIRTELESTRNTKLSEIKKETEQLTASINIELKNSLMRRVEEMEDALKQPVSIFEEQIATITELKNKLESMPYGTIHAI